jgi:hypothetical protein
MKRPSVLMGGINDTTGYVHNGASGWIKSKLPLRRSADRELPELLFVKTLQAVRLL